MLNKEPPNGHQLLVVATATERSVIQELGLWQTFDQKIPVPTVNTFDELKFIIGELDLFHDQDRVFQKLSESTQGQAIRIGIKSVLLAADTAKQSKVDREGVFAETLASIRAESDFV